MNSRVVKRNIAGYIILIAALGMMSGLLSHDVASLQSLSEVTTPKFIASVMGHLSAVITAFVGGKIIPENRNENKRTRFNDET